MNLLNRLAAIKQFIDESLKALKRKEEEYVNRQQRKHLLTKAKKEIERRWQHVLLSPKAQNSATDSPATPGTQIDIDRLLQIDDRPEELLPADTSMMDVYESADRALLILGEPGSGKTKALLELAQALLETAETSETEPIPVLFELSYWNGKKLATWMPEALSKHYYIQEEVGYTWLDDGAIVPLLDGLDKLDPVARKECVEEINDYAQDPNRMVVVCDRDEDFELWALPGSVRLLPLKDNQIQEYLKQENQLELWPILAKNSTLLEQVRHPLFLKIFLEIDRQEAIDNYQDLFETYIESRFQALETNDNSTTYDRVHFRDWLKQLAAQTIEAEETSFTLIGLQSYLWLNHLTKKWLCRGIGRSLWGIIFSTTSFIFLSLYSGWGSSPNLLVTGLVGVLILGQIGGAIVEETSGGIRGVIEKGLPYPFISSIQLIPVCGFGLAIQSIFEPIFEHSISNFWIACALLSFLVIFASNGLGTIQYLLLRIYLCLIRKHSWNQTNFLTYATQLKFLQQTDSEFRFIHDRFRDHLATYDPPS